MKPRRAFPKKLLALFLTALALVAIIPQYYPVDNTDAYTYADVAALQDQIDALRAKERELEKRSSDLASQTAGYEREKAILENQIAIINNQIEQLAVEIEQKQNEIYVSEQKILNTQATISSTLVDQYLTQDVSMLERIASSRSFSSFVDNSTKNTAAANTLARSAAAIKEEKLALEKKQKELQSAQDYQKQLKDEANARRAELQRAINANNAERSQFAADKDAAYKERLRLSQRQSEIMWELAKDSIVNGQFSKNKGGYPYQNDCPRRIDQYIDRWGMFVCECVSYGAWKVEQYYGIKVKQIGKAGSYNGGLWPTRLSGIVPMGKTPKARSIASWPDPSGSYGHVAWVEYIDESGNVWVSEYNVKRGDYSERNASKSNDWMNARFATYIYFDQY